MIKLLVFATVIENSAIMIAKNSLSLIFFTRLDILSKKTQIKVIIDIEMSTWFLLIIDIVLDIDSEFIGIDKIATNKISEVITKYCKVLSSGSDFFDMQELTMQATDIASKKISEKKFDSK